ncbi:LIM and senescent cell antigen-like-containing domain protein 1 [Varanus komodoensis]|nr:LIM and senescent cell antigen-like-containing domain protein 1 [Varanus komodoensis]
MCNEGGRGVDTCACMHADTEQWSAGECSCAALLERQHYSREEADASLRSKTKTRKRHLAAATPEGVCGPLREKQVRQAGEVHPGVDFQPWWLMGYVLPFGGRMGKSKDHSCVEIVCQSELRTQGEFIIGRVIKAMNNSWHPECFCCDICQEILADIGFVKNAGRHLCRPCHNREKARGLGKYICQKCHAIIDEQPLIFKNDPYHPDHFNCANCGKELTAEARELKGELYCLPCHDKMGVPICGACRRPIEGRVVNAMGKQWHVEHFVCAKCEKPFLGHRHYERKGLAYCETHYNQHANSHIWSLVSDGRAPFLCDELFGGFPAFPILFLFAKD